MDVSCSLRFAFRSKEEAESVLEAIRTDDEEFVNTRLDGSTVVSDIAAKSIPSLMHTLDDYLSCFTVAEEIIAERSRRSPP